MNFISARQIFHDAFANYGMGQNIDGGGGGGSAKSGPGANDNQIMNACDMGKAQAIIAKLDPAPRSWGMWAYTDEATTKDYNRVRQWVYTYYRAQQKPEYFMDYVRVYRTVVLISVALEDMKSRLNTGEPTPLKDIAIALDMKPPNVKRDGWLKRMSLMEVHIDRLDRDALTPLAQLLRR